ncbi:MAG: hypothetical protein JWO46_251 [Nocardioidaceae bacterium]|nr:hypothetical protein [Nocardioidaceae bacterium]
MRPGRESDMNPVTGPDPAPLDDDGHHPAPPYDGAVGVPSDHVPQQALVEPLDLQAWVAQTGDLDDRLVAEQQQCAGGEGEQVDAAGGDVLAEVAGADHVTLGSQLVEELGVQQVDLAEVRLVRVAGDPGQVLDQHAGVRVAVDPEPGDQLDLGDRLLAEPVLRVAVHGFDPHGREPYPRRVPVLERVVWQPRAAAHEARVDAWIEPHLARRRTGVKEPVHDFLFGYYSHRPAALRRWHPGYGVTLLDAPEYDGVKGYGRIVRDDLHDMSGTSGADRRGLSVSAEFLDPQRPLIEGIHALLVATAGRTAALGCFGLHEWAMVHRAREHGTRHDHPLRLGHDGTDAVVESHRISCSHFDAYRFFTPTARPLNLLSPTSEDRPAYEQPGCLHAGMDLYKHAFRLSPLIASELVADCFALARDIRELDMRASPYDLADLGYAPVRIETPEGKQEYVAAQKQFAERGAPLRRRLVEECERLLR